VFVAEAYRPEALNHPTPASVLPASSDGVRAGRSTSLSRSFDTYAGYARAWRIIATRDDAPHHQWSDAADAEFGVARLSAELAKEIKPGALSPRTAESAYRSLSRAWSTESLLYALFKESTFGQSRWSGDLLRASVPWVAVQAYYSCFSATQALVWVVQGRDLSGHSDVRRAFSEVWSPALCDVKPYSASVAARPAADAKAFEFVGVPPAADPTRTDPSSYWTRFEAWDVAALSLRTTLEKHLSERYGDRRARLKASRLPAVERERIRAKTHPVTMLDFLHRLRVTTNYKDADVFLVGPRAGDDEPVRHFVSNLLQMTSALLLATEMRIASVSRDGEMTWWVDHWKRLHGWGESPLIYRQAEWCLLCADETHGDDSSGAP
jgi:hypothetical protein